MKVMIMVNDSDNEDAVSDDVGEYGVPSQVYHQGQGNVLLTSAAQSDSLGDPASCSILKC